MKEALERETFIHKWLIWADGVIPRPPNDPGDPFRECVYESEQYNQVLTLWKELIEKQQAVNNDPNHISIHCPKVAERNNICVLIRVKIPMVKPLMNWPVFHNVF